MVLLLLRNSVPKTCSIMASADVIGLDMTENCDVNNVGNIFVSLQL